MIDNQHQQKNIVGELFNDAEKPYGLEVARDLKSK